MAHLSLYRKFRPDTFDKMVRQEHVVRILKNQVTSGAVGHAYLFCGPRGTGKTSVARIFARAVNCLSPVNGSPCGTCSVCRALREGSLDIAEIDAASNNGVGEMRDLREKVQYPPVSGRYKVYIIDEVHMLTDSAFNALLKTLEEPPAHAIFILATTEPHKIPATILSRCMRLDFKLISEEDLEKHLTGILDEIGKPYEREAVAAIARAGAGSDRDMLSIAEMCIAYSDKLTYEGVTKVLGAADFTDAADLCEALLRADLPAAIERTETVLSQGKAVGVLCRDLLDMLNRIAVAKTCRTAERLLSLPQAHFARVEAIAKEADGQAILRAIEILSHAETDLRFVSSPRIRLETAVMKIASPAADDSAEALLVRVNALERKLAEGTARSEPVRAAIPAETEKPAREPDYDFPTEEPVFEEALFADEPPRAAQPPRETVREPVKEPASPAGEPVLPIKEPAPPKEVPVAPPQGMSAELLFGKFMRLLRKTSRNGVLFTMCSDLEAVSEGQKLILLTGSGTVLRSLQREEHVKIMADVFSQLGVTDFEVRMKGEAAKAEKDGIAQLKEDFKNYPIEFK